MDESSGATTTGVAQVFDLHALKAFASDTRVRKMVFKTDQLWSEIGRRKRSTSSRARPP